MSDEHPVKYADIRLNAAQRKALERLFVASVAPRDHAPMAQSARVFGALEALGLAEHVIVELTPGVTARGYVITVRGHMYYCEKVATDEAG